MTSGPLTRDQAIAAWTEKTKQALTTNLSLTPIAILVQSVIDEFTSRELDFTAYTVTQALRLLFRGTRREILHYDAHGAEGVQPHVHRIMPRFVKAGLYGERPFTAPSGDAAREYYFIGASASADIAKMVQAVNTTLAQATVTVSSGPPPPPPPPVNQALPRNAWVVTPALPVRGGTGTGS